MLKKKIVSILFIIISLLILITIVTVGNKPQTEPSNIIEVKAEVLKMDDSNIIQSGITRIGDQSVIIRILEGKFKGKEIRAANHLIGKMEIDNYYSPDDIVIAGLLVENDDIISAKTIDLYRQGNLLTLFLIFVLCLIVFAKFVGLKALISFIGCLFVIYKFLIPGLLSGKSPLVLTSIVLIIMTAIIIFLVAGITKKGVIAFIGTMCGLFITMGLTLVFGAPLGLNGMTAPFAETLLYTGYMDLNMQHIFYSAIVIGAAGAAMDIGMDIAASMEEVKIKKPDVDMKELVESGFNVGRSVIGTMTTTLLLAYSGGYLTLLMLFMEKNSSLERIINLKIVSAEIMRTLIGSIGLVLVAPITAIVAGWIYTYERN